MGGEVVMYTDALGFTSHAWMHSRYFERYSHSLLALQAVGCIGQAVVCISLHYSYTRVLSTGGGGGGGGGGGIDSPPNTLPPKILSILIQ